MKRFNFLTAALEAIDQLPDGHGGAAASIGDAIGATHLGGQLYEIAPGKRLFPYHWEAGQEEWLLVIAGRPTIRTPEGERELRPGDITAFPTGPAGAHQMRNHSDEPARVIMISERRRPNVIAYPDSGKLGVRTADLQHMFRVGDETGYWDGEA